MKCKISACSMQHSHANQTLKPIKYNIKTLQLRPLIVCHLIFCKSGNSRLCCDIFRELSNSKFKFSPCTPKRKTNYSF